MRIRALGKAVRWLGAACRLARPHETNVAYDRAATTFDKLALPKTSGTATLKRAAASISVRNVPVGTGTLVLATLQKHRIADITQEIGRRHPDAPGDGGAGADDPVPAP
jgi:hypothetical protein